MVILTKKDKTKDKLVKVGFQQYVNKGVFHTSLDDILTLAKISKGSFYNIFKTKDDLLVELLKFTIIPHLRSRTNYLLSLSDDIKHTVEVTFTQLEVEMNELSNSILGENSLNYKNVFSFIQDCSKIDCVKDLMNEHSASDNTAWCQRIELEQENGALPKSLSKNEISTLFVTIGTGGRILSSNLPNYSYDNLSFVFNQIWTYFDYLISLEK